MRILQVHNAYESGTGGEDTVIQQEKAMLEGRKHKVAQWMVTNKNIKRNSLAEIANTIWSVRSYTKVKKKIERIRPDIVHVHNTFARLSPSVFWGAKAKGIPIVTTIHNYRYICGTALLMNDTGICEKCVGKDCIFLEVLKNDCKYKGRKRNAMMIAAIKSIHKMLKTFERKVDGIIVLSEFAKNVLIRDGFPENKIYVKSNFVAGRSQCAKKERKLVYVGTLTREKGVDIALEAWRKKRLPGWKLVFIGSGEMERAVRESSAEGVEYRGRLEWNEVQKELASSVALLMPSRCYEGMPMAVLEALSNGTQAIVPKHGPFPEIVEDAVSGLLFDSGSVEKLALMIEKVCKEFEEWGTSRSKECIEIYKRRYSEKVAYGKLMKIYETVVSETSG